jgi:DNA polymerase I-like protein with 3'-5' exonuclease and polymerase domains
VTVFDIETDGLDPTKIHVLSWEDELGKIQHTHDYVAMRIFFEEATILIGHNIVRYDIPAVEKILGIKVTATLVDTLAVSWYINHTRPKHGLEGYGEYYNVKKPEITDWESLTKEEYAHRCNEDVKINVRLWRDLDIKLSKLYPNVNHKWDLLTYLTFKMQCAAEQEALKWKLDVDKANKYLAEWGDMKEDKIEQLAEAMPKRVLTKVQQRPKVMHKKDGSLSSHGERFEELRKEYRQPENVQSFVVKTGEVRGNPSSPEQVKEWLYSIGWVPRTFKFVRGSDDQEKQIPQIRREGELCPSVKDLVSEDPAVSILDGLSVLSHRISVLKGMVEHEVDGYVQATVAGMTNTLRFKHAKPLVNIPSVEKPYGKEIRGCLTAPEGYVLCGADMTSLEDTTKRHYMKPLDPSYVAEMSKEGFDPHLDLAKHAGIITQEDIDKHNSGEKSLKALRKNYKVVNYSATYGVGAAKLARETGMTKKEAQKLLDAFWSRNWSVQKVASTLRKRELFGGMWVQNPVSGFWYSLRSEKDRFSTLNQGTGVYCFDNWVKKCREKGIKTIGQFHDEIIALVKEGDQIETAMNMNYSIQELNEQLKLNVDLGVDAQFGKTYAEIH